MRESSTTEVKRLRAAVGEVEVAGEAEGGGLLPCGSSVVGWEAGLEEDAVAMLLDFCGGPEVAPVVESVLSIVFESTIEEEAGRKDEVASPA